VIRGGRVDAPSTAEVLATWPPRPAAAIGDVLDQALETAMSLLQADRGNVQILDPATGSLRIVAQCGFDTEFLEYFADVDFNSSSACGRALKHLEQTVITDVNADPRFAAHKDIAAASRFSAVQSTPLIDLQGQAVGVLSTHYRRPYEPPARDLRIMMKLGVLVGEVLSAPRSRVHPV
jgi:GAF domain-containing protein